MFVDQQERHWAEEFVEILPTLAQRGDLCDEARALLAQPMPGKATEGEERLSTFRALMVELITGRLTLAEAYSETERRLPRHASRHASSNQVFAAGWSERLVRTQLSRLYNQAVLNQLMSSGQTKCFVPHSPAEKPDSPCSRLLAGQEHETAPLLDRLVRSYTMGTWTKEVKIPDHPHCTHVVTPSRV